MLQWDLHQVHLRELLSQRAQLKVTRHSFIHVVKKDVSWSSVQEGKVSDPAGSRTLLHTFHSNWSSGVE